MATYTSYLNLEKPTTSETFNLLKMNQNWDKIDAGVSALNSKVTPVQFLKHYDGNNLQIPFVNYCSALCVMFLEQVGSATLDIRRTGSGITKTHLAGLESVTNGLTLTVSEGIVTFSASNNMHFTLMLSNNA